MGVRGVLGVDGGGATAGHAEGGADSEVFIEGAAGSAMGGDNYNSWGWLGAGDGCTQAQI